MRNIEDEEGFVRLYSGNDELAVACFLDTIGFYYYNEDGNNKFIVDESNEFLYKEIDTLYNSIMDKRNGLKKIYEPDIVKDGHIEVHDCDYDIGEANFFTLEKLDNGAYEFTFTVLEKDYYGVKVCFNGLDTERQMYSPYDRLFVKLYRNLYKHRMEEDKKLTLKK